MKEQNQPASNFDTLKCHEIDGQVFDLSAQDQQWMVKKNMADKLKILKVRDTTISSCRMY